MPTGEMGHAVVSVQNGPSGERAEKRVEITLVVLES